MTRGTRRAHVGQTHRAIVLACLGLVLAAGIANSAPIPVPSFAAKRSYPTGGKFPSFVRIVDLNGDGHPDLVALEGSRLSVFLNGGDGGFRPRSDYQTGPSPDAGALADLNGDGRPDLVTASRDNGGTLSVLLNRGDGSFAGRRGLRPGGGIPTLAIADVDGDGRPDLVVGHGGTVSVFRDNGDGTFQPKQDYATGLSDPWSLAVADLNGDGEPDTVLEGAKISVLLNTGDGTFGAHRLYEGTGDALAVGDLNGDGRPDLVTAAVDGEGWASVFLNRGDGSFRPRHNYSFTGGIIPGGGGGPASVQIADLNGDGKPDLVTLDESARDFAGVGFSVLLNRGDGTFGSRRDYRVSGGECSGCGLQSLAIGDVNGDGRPDLAVTDDEVNLGHSVSLFLNKGHGGFQVRRDYPADLLPSNIAIADLNGDRRPDLVATAAQTVSVLLNKPGLCNVQEVVGLKPALAKWRLARVDCRVVIRRVFDPKRDRSGGCGCGFGQAYWPKSGLVYTEKPRFGAVLPAGGTIHLVVRFGRAR